MTISKRILIRRGILFLGMVLAIAAVFVTFKTWQASARLDQELAALREAGEPLTVAEWLESMSPPKDSDHGVSAYEALRTIRDELRQMDAELARTKFGQETEGIYQDRLLTATGAEQLRRILDLAPNANTALRMAGDASYLGAPLNDEALITSSEQNLELLQEYRAASRFLFHQCDLLLFDGQRDEACDTALLLLRLSRQFDDHPSLTGYLTSLALRGIGFYALNQVLRTGDVSPDARAKIDDELQRCEEELGFARALRSERVVGLQSYRQLPGFSRLAWWLRDDTVSYLHLMRDEIAAAETPYHKYPRSQPSENLGTLAKLIVPAIDACRAATNRTLAQTRCLRVLNKLQAIEATKIDGKDLGTTLGLPTEAVTDPFDGKLLRTRHVDGRWIVYSVGENLRDDQGESHPVTGDLVAGTVTH